ncbi:MAG: sugar phosphate isomerase/epimerase [Planctomycetaceae bacterium]|nr:sugar phosphate isomerase/epimerase [Planctomycetaceae bacterium]
MTQPLRDDHSSEARVELSRRAALSSAVAGGAFAFGSSLAAAFEPRGEVALADTSAAQANPVLAKEYDMKKSINLWAFPYSNPYPNLWSLEKCLQVAKDAGFDGIELNYDLDSDLSPKSGTKDFQKIRTMADKIGIAISGLCSFLFWPYPLVSNDAEKRARGMELAGMMAQAAHDLGTENLLVVPGAVCIPWRTDHDPVPNDVCDKRAREAVRKLLPAAEKLKVHLNIENIFFNGYLMTPGEMADFVDSFKSEYVRVHFDSGNIALFQYPEHWVNILGKRIKNVHLKEFTKKGTDHSLESFRPLLDGTTNWPALLDAFDATGYRGYLTFEYFHPYQFHPEALIAQTGDSLDRLLGRKS